MSKNSYGPMRAFIVAAAFSLLAASAAHAGGVVNDGQSQGQKGGHHLSGTQHRGGHESGTQHRGHKGVAPNVGPIHIICAPYCTGGGSL